MFRKQNETTFCAPSRPLSRAVAVLGRCPEQHPVIPRHIVYICIHLTSYLQPPFMPPVRGNATKIASGWAGNRVPRDFLHLESPNLWSGWHLEKQGDSWVHHTYRGGRRERRRARRRVPLLASSTRWLLFHDHTAGRNLRASHAAGFLPDKEPAAGRLDLLNFRITETPAGPQEGGDAARRGGSRSPSQSGKPARGCDAATRRHLRSRACRTRAAPGGKRGEVGTWARGS